MMEATYEVKEGYLCVSISGEFNAAIAREITLEWIELARRHGLNRALCDITHLVGFTQRVSVVTQFDISEFLARSLPTDFNLAVLETPEQVNAGRFGETILVNRGVSVRVTPSLDEALEWLRVTSAGIPNYQQAEGGVSPEKL